MEKQEIGKLTDAEIAALKNTNEAVYEVTAEDENGNTHFGYFKKPNRAVLGNYTDKMASGKIWEANGTLYKSCWLGGSPEIDKVDELFVGVIQRVTALFKPAQSSLKKL